jgi:hypothetical protein
MTTAGLPHRFSYLLGRSRELPVLFCGAGLSFGLVPGPDELLENYQTVAESALGCGPITLDDSEAQNEPGRFYWWAERALAGCSGGDLRPKKLRLSDSLSILRDPRWLGRAGLPLRRTTPRHRVIARLAREGIWSAVWSLNWDCLLENAFEEVGLVRDGPPYGFSWKTAYVTHITNRDITKLGRGHCVRVHKPHGCVRAMVAAEHAWQQRDNETAQALSERFMIGAQELTRRDEDAVDRGFADAFGSELRSHPMIVIGWKAAEPILQQGIKRAVAALPDKPNLSVIDIAFNDNGHRQIANEYGLTPEQVHFQVFPEDCPTTDRLFLWIQAQYALDCLRAHCPGNIEPTIKRWADSLKNPCGAAFFASFADNFLPAWMRLCWRAGVVRCRSFEPHLLDLSKPEVHVPWDIANIERPDLRAAAQLLARLPDAGGDWDAARFPGALWRVQDLCLAVPLPAWGEPASLSGLNPLLQALERDIAFVRKLTVLPLHPDGQQIASADAQRLVEGLAGLVRVPSFAESGRIEIQRYLE